LWGPNSSGKSALIRALLLLKQSIAAADPQSPLIFSGRWVDLGSYYNAVHRHDRQRDITFGFRLSRPPFDEPPPQRRDDETDADFEERGKDYERRLNDYKAQAVSTLWSAQEPTGPKVSIDDDQVELSLTFGLLPDAPTPALKRLVISGRRTPEQGEPVSVIVFKCERDQDGHWQPSSDAPLDYETEEGEDENRHLVSHPQFSHWLWAKFRPDLGVGPIPLRLRVPDVADMLRSDRPPDWQVVDQALDFFYKHLGSLLDGMVYLPPLREEPRRHYRAGHEWVRAIRGSGLTAVNRWMEGVGLHGGISIRDIDKEEGILSIYVQESGQDGGLRVNLRDVGSGVSQLLPVVAKTLAGAADKFVVIEQPELHLHPGAQAKLADLFIEIISSKPRPAGPTFLLETHSENLLLRFRVRLAQTTAYPDQSPKLYREDFGAIFVERDGNVTRVEPIEFDDVGAYVKQPEGFVEFFGDDFAELQALRRARSDAATTSA
jgi:hypothetical protein